MPQVEKLQRDVAALTAEELALFREWFTAFDDAEWDRVLERDSAAGALEKFAAEALAEHRAGRTRPL